MIQISHKQKGCTIALCTLLVGAGSVWYLTQKRLPEDTIKIVQNERKVRPSVEKNISERKIKREKSITKKPFIRKIREPKHRNEPERKRPRRPNSKNIKKTSLEPAA